MHFNFTFNYINKLTEDSSIPLADWCNVIIAIINFIFVVYIFKSQIDKEKQNQKFQERTISNEYKHTWFKEIVILPQLNYINKHFENLEFLSQTIKSIHLNKNLKLTFDKKLKKEFNDFNTQFISNLYSFEMNFAEVIESKSDKCLADIQNVVFDNGFISNNLFNESIVVILNDYKSSIYKSIYTFENFL